MIKLAIINFILVTGRDAAGQRLTLQRSIWYLWVEVTLRSHLQEAKAFIGLVVSILAPLIFHSQCLLGTKAVRQYGTARVLNSPHNFIISNYNC